MMKCYISLKKRCIYTENRPIFDWILFSLICFLFPPLGWIIGTVLCVKIYTSFHITSYFLHNEKEMSLDLLITTLTRLLFGKQGVTL
jgi:hypothetical protein